MSFIELETITMPEISSHGSPSLTPQESPEELPPDEYPDGGLQAYLVVLGAFLGCVVNLGVINSIGAVQMWVSGHQLAEYSALTISWVFSIYLALSYMLTLLGGIMFDRYGPFWVMIVSAAFLFLGLMAIANCVEIWQFILAFIALGIGNGLGMSPSVGVISHWFHRKRGLMTGIATSGGLVGGLVFPLLLRFAYAKYGFEWAIRIFAFTVGGCMIAATILLKERFTHTKPVHVPVDTIPISKWRKIKRKLRVENLDRTYWALVAGAFFTELSLVLIVTYFTTYSVAKGASESTALILITVWNAAGIPGRWLPGWISDHFGRFNVNVVMLCLYSLMIWIVWLPFGTEPAMYAFAVLGGFFSGSVLSLLPACLSQITPVREIGQRYGFLNGFLAMANLFGVPIASAIIKLGSLHDYDHFVIFVSCLATVGTFLWGVDRCLIGGVKLSSKV